MKLVFHNDDLLGMSEAARLLRISRMALHNWVKSGKIQAVKVGPHRAIPKSEVERLRLEH